MAICTDNSTECLLQKVVAALDQANSAFNWGLPTLVVTSIIGLIAMGFALLPVLQAVRYPPDRVKYSRDAIGKWYDLRGKNFNWAEMRYAVTTWTPILDFEVIAEYLIQKSIEEQPSRTEDDQPKNVNSASKDLEAALSKTPTDTMESRGGCI
jgi:hypothetical protein